MVLRQGDQGDAVEQLQLKLKAAGYYQGDIDGDFGKLTHDAVLAFQLDRPDVDDDAEVGGQTMGALNAAIAKRKPDAQVAKPPATYVPCNDPTWKAFMGLVDALTKRPVRYGPGRGLWVDTKFVITYGAGKLGGTPRQWPNMLGVPYSSFHCTSFTNFILSWLTRRNGDFTHAGNIPSLFELLEGGPEVHQAPGQGPWRGFGDVCFPLPPDGSGAKRSGVPKVVDARELLDRAHKGELPTFIVCGQSTKKGGGWNWWHHTVLFVMRDNRLYRIAADGYKGAQGYSAKPMQWVEVTPANVAAYDACVYRAYGVGTKDGSYGDQSRPIATVGFEF